MEAAFNLFLWGIAGALALVVPGACFGAASRIAAYLRQEAFETSLKQAVMGGMLQGGMFLGGFGFLAGLLIGWQAHIAEEGFRSLLLIAGGTALLMFGALLLAGVAYFWIWLGERYLGLFLSITITGGLLAVIAWKCGAPRETAALGALSLAILAAMIAAIARWFAPAPPRPSAAEVAEALWHDWQNVAGDELREKPSTDDRFHTRD